MSRFILTVHRINSLLWLAIAVLATQIALLIIYGESPAPEVSARGIKKGQMSYQESGKLWRSPDVFEIPRTAAGELVRYGRELIEHTALYLGPQGKIAAVSNGMNCQNCHLQGGTKLYGANYSAVASTYPKFRQRSGTVEGFEKRVNDCFERSLNGVGLPYESAEMKAIVAYLKWVGKDVPKAVIPEGAGLMKLPFLDRRAEPLKGQHHYVRHCSSCHGNNGEGTKDSNGIEWKYPPLWGVHSYNTGAGLYRLSKLAAFIKGNMPYGISYENPVLSDEEAWDIAAFINSKPRPHRNFSQDWPDITRKPIDHPFGPYADGLSEETHKYGPFGQILAAKNK